MVSGHVFAHEVVGQRPLGEQDDVMLAGLLDLGQVCQNREHPDRAVLDDDGLSGRAEAEFGHLLAVCSGSAERSTLGNATPSKAGELESFNSISFFNKANIFI